ncbi:MAG: hypothetical protein WEA36_00665 [Balneolaceae bacterium]
MLTTSVRAKRGTIFASQDFDALLLFDLFEGIDKHLYRLGAGYRILPIQNGQTMSDQTSIWIGSFVELVVFGLSVVDSLSLLIKLKNLNDRPAPSLRPA